MLSLAEINDTEITRKKGIAGSVMDYNPLNISRKGEKQGDYATTTIGPYDYWAIEYAYKPFSSGEEKELKKIAARSPEGDLTYATDEDLYSSNDPLVNAYDLGDDPLAYVIDRVALAAELARRHRRQSRPRRRVVGPTTHRVFGTRQPNTPTLPTPLLPT